MDADGYTITVSDMPSVAVWGTPVRVEGTTLGPPEVRYNALSPHGEHVATLAIVESGGRTEVTLREYKGGTLNDRHLTIYPNGRVEGGDRNLTAKPLPNFFGKLSRIFAY